MNTAQAIKKFIVSDWFIGLLLLGIFLIANGYTVGWDDQHLEIPLLKKLIDPHLYPNDYYVSTLKTNFMSFFYPILARFITINQILPTYFVLYLISRYFFLFFSYKLWHYLSGEKIASVLCVSSMILLIRVEEFLYRTFSHQEFALAFIFAGIYFFYRERFILSAIILGFGAQMHALYSLFPMIYMLAFLLVYHKKHRISSVFKAGFSFFVVIIPLVMWIVHRQIIRPPGDTNLYANWIELYKIACPQNFIFYTFTLKEIASSLSVFFQATREYLFIGALCLLNYLHNEDFKRDKKTQMVIYSSLGLIMFSFFFTYVRPTRFILDLNLIRNMQFMLYFLAGYTVLLLWRTIQNIKAPFAFILALLFIFCEKAKYHELLSLSALIAITGVLSLYKALLSDKTAARTRQIILSLLGIGVAAVGIYFGAHEVKLNIFVRLNIIGIPIILWIIFMMIQLKIFPAHHCSFRKLLVIIPIFFLLCNYGFYHKRMLHKFEHGLGFWQMQRNWVDMQLFVKNNTPKNALIFVPYDMEMGGFRIFSERSIVCSYRDCGIIGFDYEAAVEWKKRLADIEAFKVYQRTPIDSAVRNAITQYRAHYIVFMKYSQPNGVQELFKKVYANDVFALYAVVPNQSLLKK